MICGYNDWDQALDEAHMRGILEGRITPPPPAPKPTLEDYGRSITFSLADLEAK